MDLDAKLDAPLDSLIESGERGERGGRSRGRGRGRGRGEKRNRNENGIPHARAATLMPAIFCSDCFTIASDQPSKTGLI